MSAHADIEELIAQLKILINREIHDHGKNSPIRIRLAECAEPLVFASGMASAREAGEDWDMTETRRGA